MNTLIREIVVTPSPSATDEERAFATLLLPVLDLVGLTAMAVLAVVGLGPTNAVIAVPLVLAHLRPKQVGALVYRAFRAATPPNSSGSGTEGVVSRVDNSPPLETPPCPSLREGRPTKIRRSLRTPVDRLVYTAPFVIFIASYPMIEGQPLLALAIVAMHAFSSAGDALRRRRPQRPRFLP